MVSFWDSGQGILPLPDPASYDLSFPANVQPILTQGGFFVPLEAPDDVEAVAQLRWEDLGQSELDSLRVYAKSSLLVLNEPMGLKPFGYISNLEYQGIEGRVSRLAESVYSASVTFNVTHLEWPWLLPEFEQNKTYALGAKYGISSTGTQPVEFTGERATQTDGEGWALARGGDVDPWGPVMPPTKQDFWDRNPRTRFYPTHGIQASYLGVRSALLSPERGSVFFAFKPLAPS